ncbi:MAG: MBL fold metallo-hydrolase, partial [Deltaproteobacteria bacterium]|nr:MBL fold metallo-hydrolase [Deltaproteobacteria bacterium]
MLKITALVENTSPNPDLFTESGLSLYIETADKRILFDTGVTGKIIDNAEKLNVSLDKIDLCVISHGHFDHTGGLINFLKLNAKAPVYMKPDARGAYFFKMGPVKKYIGIPPGVFTMFEDRIDYIDKKTEIAPGVTIITDIPQTRPLGKQNAKFFRKTENGLVKDLFSHELI